MHPKFWSEYLKGRDHLGDLGIYERKYYDESWRNRV
jgi:hypothetical protein